jgi:3-methylcrotonyl-CoA carboxylase alpha subunit
MRLFDKILIANRGEIACRIARTARRMGIATVAVYSDADVDARHVALCDEAVHIGGPAPAESYLRGERIIDAAIATGARAIHPGYGFLSENEGFARACAHAGLVFIGPPVAAIEAMGSKSAAKSLLESAGVPLTPGYHGDDQSPALLAREALRIGYPVLIKASAGGGGKGMRRVDAPGEFAAALASCQREARAAFGDDRVLVEKYVLRPRHIEIQVFGDTQGNVVHLFERDCSVQRRHQKVLEEAPAPGMTAERRAAMGRAATEAARAVGYVGAGTVEFIVAPDGAFFFMEMNTRLQVEHPVTEMITGLDLVEWQLRVAMGEPLPLAQEQLEIRGHAIEARVYAEDPHAGFLPSTGLLAHLEAPAESAHVRVDTGVRGGDAITPFYDPMIAKLIVWDESRERARARLLQALAQYRIVGVRNNLEFLSRLAACPAFAHADLDTALIEREREFLFPPPGAPPAEAGHLAALAILLHEAHGARAAAEASADPHSPWHLRDGWRLKARAERRIVLRAGDEERVIGARYRDAGFELDMDGRAVEASGTLCGDTALRAVLDGRRLEAHVVAHGARVHVFVAGRCHVFTRIDPLQYSGDVAASDGSSRAPMPGRVVALLAAPGAEVAKGAPLLVLEAMKMEHTLVAPAAGTLAAYRVAVGDQVVEGAELYEFRAADTAAAG